MVWMDILTGLVALLVLSSPIWGIGGIIILLAGIRIIVEYERSVRFRLGKYKDTLQPGLNFIIPFIDTTTKVDIRVTTVDVPKQEVMTKDNVPIMVDAVIYFKVIDPKKAILNIQDYHYAVAQYSRTALRDIIGKIELDELLAVREKVAEEIKIIVDKATESWGLDVIDIKMQDVELPADMKRAMARQAEAEREKRATVIKAEGEKVAAKNLLEAAQTMSKSPGAIHLRTLQTINDVSPDQSNTIIFALPIQVMAALEKFSKGMK